MAWGYVVIAPGIAHSELAAQTSHTLPLSVPTFTQNRNMTLSYNQNNNIYYWQVFASFDKSIGKGIFSFRNNLDINRIKLRTIEDKWKDNNQLNMRYVLPLAERFATVVNARSTYLSDLQTGFLNNITEYSLLVQFPVDIKQTVSISPSIGYKWDKRISNTDKGPQFGIDATIKQSPLGDYDTDARLHYLSENLDERRYVNFDMSLSLYRTFYSNTSDTLQYSKMQQRRDYYVSLAGNLETRKEDMQEVSNILRYDLFDRTNIRIQTDFAQGDVVIESTDNLDQPVKRTRKENRFLVDVSLETRRGSHYGKLFLKIDQKQQRHTSNNDDGRIFGSIPFDNPDNNNNRIKLGLSGYGSLFNGHTYTLQGFIEKFQYETPAKNRFDDLDEFRFWFKGTYGLKLSPRLSVSLSSLASLDHQVYIFSQRSADNNWTRIFQSGVLVEYQTRNGTRVTANFNVLANYVDYDFDDSFVQVRSFVFRRFLMNQNLVLPVTRKGRVEILFQLNLEENGLLKWDQFMQNILSDRTIVSGTLKYVYRLTPTIEFMPGVSFYTRNEARNQAKTLHGIQRRLSKIDDRGINLNVRYQTSPSSLITISSSKRFVRRGDIKENFQYVDLSVNWLF